MLDVSWYDVGFYVERARAVRRQKALDFAKEIGVSPRTLSSIENGNGERYDAITIHRIESALGWKPGTFERLAVHGGKPAYEHRDPLLARIVDAWPRLSPEVRRILSDNAGTAILGE